MKLFDKCNKLSLRLELLLTAIAVVVLSCVTITPSISVHTPIEQVTKTTLSQPTTIIEPTASRGATVQPALTAAAQPTSTVFVQPIDTASAQATSTPSNSLRVSFIDVGQGDAILILAPDGKIMLIDGGDTNTGIVQFLQRNNVQRIDLMVATHPHSDHIGGLVQVLTAIPVTKVITNGQMHTSSIYEHFLDAIAFAKAEYAEVQRGDIIALGNLSFSVLNPTTNTGDLNHNSLVLRLDYGEVSFLFTGDADKDAEASMISAGLPLQVTILKVGHHGSRYSSSPAFLAQVKPEVAIYSAGTGNLYGHPHPETLAALAAAGARVYGTDVNGTITVITDGISYEVVTGEGGPRAPPSTAPTTASTQGSLDLVITSVTSPVAPGGTATLVAQTMPGAACTITVYYKSGPSQASGLEPKTADSSGGVSWTWKVGSRTSLGTWRVVVTASANGQTITKEATFTVAR